MVSDLVGLAEHGVSPQVEYIHLTVVEEKKGVLLHEVAGGAGVPQNHQFIRTVNKGKFVTLFKGESPFFCTVGVVAVIHVSSPAGGKKGVVPVQSVSDRGGGVADQQLGSALNF